MAIDLKTITTKAKEQIKSLLQKQPLSVIALAKEGTKWKVQVEVLERKAVPDTQDLIGIYELLLTEAGDLSSYKQIEVRHRGLPYGQASKEE